MKVTTKRVAMLCAGLGAVGAIGAFTFAGTSAQYTSTESTQSNSIDSGTITLSDTNTGPNTSGASTASTFSNFIPGDAACNNGTGTFTPTPAGPTWNCNRQPNTYFMYYEGSAPAFVGLDVEVTSTAANACSDYSANTHSVNPADLATKCQGTGQLPLFNGSTASAMDLDVAPVPTNIGAVELVTPTSMQNAAKCSTNANDQVVCTASFPHLLVPYSNPGGYTTDAASKLIWPSSSVAAPTTIAISAYSHLASTAGNQTQGSTTTIALTGSAVQSGNNTGHFLGTPGCASDTLQPAYFPAANTTTVLLPCPQSWS